MLALCATATGGTRSRDTLTVGVAGEKPDEVVAKGLHESIPLLWRGGRRSLTGWLLRGTVEKYRFARS